MHLGCLLSPFLFTLVGDWIMRTSTEGKRNGIQWTLRSQLVDLDFANDLALLSHRHAQMQDKTTCLDSTSATTGLHINNGKTKIMMMRHASNSPVTVAGQPLEEVSSFTHLGSMVDKLGGTDADMRARIGRARTAFLIIKKVWSSPEIGTSTNLRIFNTNVKSVLLCGLETWKMTKSTLNTLQTFMKGCLQKILCIRWPEKISNEDLWNAADQEPVATQIRRRKWGWIGHTLRKPASNITKQALTRYPQGKRKRERPMNTWHRDNEAEMHKSDHCWKELEKTAQSRVCWQSVVDGLCSSWGKRPK